MTNTIMNHYEFQLLQYAPNLVSGEHVNVAVLLYDPDGRLLEARFAREFRRLRCHPLADLEYLEALRNEFEEHRLLGEGFSEYGRQLQRDLSAALQVSEQHSFWGGEAAVEIERLYGAYVATPAAEQEETGGPRPGTRHALRRAMADTFRRYHLLANGKRLLPDASVRYGPGRLQFTFDYAYPPNGASRYVQGIALHNDVRDASKLCFVLERLRAREQAGVAITAVVDDQVPHDTLELLEDSDIRPWQTSKLDDLALAIRGELGL